MTSIKERGAEVAACLMRGPKTLSEILEFFDSPHGGTVRDGLEEWVYQYRCSGCAYIESYIKVSNGQWVKRYAWQPSLFHHPDAQKP